MLAKCNLWLYLNHFNQSLWTCHQVRLRSSILVGKNTKSNSSVWRVLNWNFNINQVTHTHIRWVHVGSRTRQTWCGCRSRFPWWRRVHAGGIQVKLIWGFYRLVDWFSFAVMSVGLVPVRGTSTGFLELLLPTVIIEIRGSTLRFVPADRRGVAAGGQSRSHVGTHRSVPDRHLHAAAAHLQHAHGRWAAGQEGHHQAVQLHHREHALCESRTPTPPHAGNDDDDDSQRALQSVHIRHPLSQDLTSGQGTTSSLVG